MGRCPREYDIPIHMIFGGIFAIFAVCFITTALPAANEDKFCKALSSICVLGMIWFIIGWSVWKDVLVEELLVIIAQYKTKKSRVLNSLLTLSQQ